MLLQDGWLTATCSHGEHHGTGDGRELREKQEVHVRDTGDPGKFGAVSEFWSHGGVSADCDSVQHRVVHELVRNEWPSAGVLS